VHTSDVAVIGAGIIGLSAAHALQETGLSVTVYDRGSPGTGQSTGTSRLFRHAHDDARMIDLAVRARLLWDAWSAEFGTELVSTDGAVALGESAARRFIPLGAHPSTTVRALDAAELRSVMPVLADYEGPAMFDERAGAIRTHAAIDALAGKLGGSLIIDPVLAIRPLGTGGVEVRTGANVSSHGAVVVCAGQGTAALAAAAGISVPVRVTAHARSSFRVREPGLTTLPNLQDGSGAFGETGVYAAAYPDRSAMGLGTSAEVAPNEFGGVSDPGMLAAVADQAAAYVSRALPGLDPEPIGYVHCWVTTLPWGDDGVAIWQADNTFFLAGHNLFKHAPVLGEALAQSVTESAVPELFRPESMLGTAALT
jgi:sarcosine oxidase